MGVESRAILHDHEFQDFLADANIMRRREIPSGGLDLKPNKVSTRPTSPTSVKFLERLNQDCGYIVPKEDVSDAIYGNSDKFNQHATLVWSNEVRNRLQSPENFLIAKELGFAVGVEEFRLYHATLPVVYKLWQKMWDNVGLSELAAFYYGDSGGVAKSSMRSILYNLRKNVLPSTDARIDLVGHTRERETYFRLHYLDDERNNKYIKPENGTPAYLEFDFQDWLACSDVRLMQRSNEANKPFQKKPSNDFGTFENRALEKLKSSTGYVLSYDYLTLALYQEYGERIKIRDVVKRIRAKLVNPDSIMNVPEVGYGALVNEFGLRRREAQVLNLLWQNLEGPVEIGDLSEDMYGRTRLIDIQNTRRVISTIREKLEDTGYVISTKRRVQAEKVSYTLASI